MMIFNNDEMNLMSLHSAPNGIPSLGRPPSPSYTAISTRGGRTPFHLACTPWSIAAAMAASSRALDAVSDFGSSTVQPYFGSSFGFFGGCGASRWT